MFARDTSEWINRVNQKHKQLIELGLSTEQKDILERWQETEFVYSTLKLEGTGVSREQVARIASNKSGAMPVTDSEQDAGALLASLRIVGSLAREKGKASELSADLLLKLRGAQAAAGFRSGPGNTSQIPKPVTPEHLPALLEGAFRWYTAESFTELNPVEQASIVLLRLIDLQPFEQANERTALVAASLFTMRSELPPIIIRPEITSAYRNALNEATRMNTKPMVETVAEAVEKSLAEMIQQFR